MNHKKFKKWLREYKSLNRIVLQDYWKKTGTKVTIPEGFDKELLQQYISYRNDMRTKQLVLATWGLAIATIILSGLTLILK